jgi:hypothetical protein
MGAADVYEYSSIDHGVELDRWWSVVMDRILIV